MGHWSALSPPAAWVGQIDGLLVEKSPPSIKLNDISHLGLAVERGCQIMLAIGVFTEAL
jgi:hypothetical protein